MFVIVQDKFFPDQLEDEIEMEFENINFDDRTSVLVRNRVRANTNASHLSVTSRRNSQSSIKSRMSVLVRNRVRAGTQVTIPSRRNSITSNRSRSNTVVSGVVNPAFLSPHYQIQTVQHEVEQVNFNLLTTYPDFWL